MHTKIRKEFKRNESDVKNYKGRMDLCLLRLRECETNIEELKHLHVEDGQKYEAIVKKNLLIGMTTKIRAILRDINKVKNINTGGVGPKKDSGSVNLLGGYDEEDQSEFGFLNTVSCGAIADLENPTSIEQMSIFEVDKAKQEALAMDTEITKLADTVTNLHAMFKQMNDMVYEQG